MNDSGKRKSANQSSGPMEKRRTGPKQWRVTRPAGASNGSIEPGGAGIWATCAKGREGKCTRELQDIFAEYAEKLYPATENDEGAKSGNGDEDDDDDAEDIEAEIKREVEAIRKPKKDALFRAIRIDVQCVIFFQTRAPIEPVSFVHRICADAVESSAVQRSRWVQRLTPMTLMGKATEKGLEDVARAVLAPHFHAQAQSESPKKFAIRPTIRNHHSLTRDGVIKQLADVVGPAHKVDLKHYDLLILVEIYRNVCGMSVVGGDFERLKRYNLAEIFQPTPKTVAASKEGLELPGDEGGAPGADVVGMGTTEPNSAPAFPNEVAAT